MITPNIIVFATTIDTKYPYLIKHIHLLVFISKESCDFFGLKLALCLHRHRSDAVILQYYLRLVSILLSLL